MNSNGHLRSEEEVLKKMESWCAYRDRCTYEVQTKLLSFELTTESREKILEHLIETKFVDDERYAESYISGKFRIKKWGRVKIRQMLFPKKIDKATIDKYLSQLDDDGYIHTIDDLIEKKDRLLSSTKDPWQKREKLMRYLVGRGFEWDLVQDRLNFRDSSKKQ